MTTPAENIPVANAVPVPNIATPATTTEGDLFQPLSFSQSYLRRFLHVYVGHLDTFLTITILAALPALLGYQHSSKGWFSRTLFQYFLLPLSQLMADGAAVTATALIYLLPPGHKIPWTIAIQTAFQKKPIARFLLLILSSHWLGRFLNSLTGVFAFASQFLLLEPNNTNFLQAMLQSSQFVVFRALLPSLFFTFCLAPILSWILETIVACLWWKPPPLEIPTGEDEDGNDPLPAITTKNYSNIPTIRPPSALDILLLPILSCLWTILFLNLRIQKGLTRQALANQFNLSLPPPTLAVQVH